MGNRKVAIIGAGFVGASIAFSLTVKGLSREIVLIDINQEKARGEALDIQHGIPYMGISSVRAGDYPDCTDCDLIIITAGRNRRPGETRLDMLADNVSIMRNVINRLQCYYTRGTIMIVSNPVDVLTYKVDEWMNLPNGRVLGTGCILDSSRLVREIANCTNLSIEAIKCNIVGEHGDTQFPVWSRLSIAGVPMEEYCENVNLPWGEVHRQAIYESVKTMGADIIAAKGRTHYGISSCVCALADAVLNQRLTIAPVTTPFMGEYGIRDVSLSIPSIIGVNGVEHRLEEHWTNEEYAALKHSAERVREALESVRNY